MGRPVVLSTGGGKIKEIKESVKILKKNNTDFALLHCVSEYPCSFDRLGLEKINKFAEKDQDFWKPADLLVALANNGGKFADAPTDDLKKEKLAFKQEVKY